MRMNRFPSSGFALNKLTLALLNACVAMVLAGCGTVKVQPLSVDAVRQQAALDRQAAQAEVPPVVGALSLDEAIARALKYNLNQRTRMMEEAYAFHQFDTTSWDMLPRVMANAGYTWRDKELITRSEDSVTGAPSLANPFISSERAHPAYSLGLTWNVLDFGLGYITAKQAADRVNIGVERRRKAMHVLIQDVRSAFWRTASAQKLHKQVRETIAMADAAVKDARQAEAERLRAPVDALRYQRQLLENLRLLESIEQELGSGRIELAGLINAPLNQPLEVVEPGDQVNASLLETPVERMEELAISNNADIREQFYNGRIAVEETRRTILRLFPNLSFNYDLRYDGDRYLINNRWNDAGLQLSYNLLNLLSAPSQKRFADAGVKLADQRRVAAQMTVLTQLHLARLQYHTAWRQYVRADEIWQADAKIAEHIKNKESVEAQSKLEQVANSTTAILSLLRRYQSLAQLQGAASKVQATMGLEPEIGSVTDMSLDQLTHSVGTAMRSWNKGLSQPAAAAPAQ
ncbi:TolC family protein [Massilia sp. BSC265]|uniref:TolC family protein n=1 Tax=Massilia sp. BSC265 TaxID=1549812 RepID=UPI000AB8110D|nr:TolC family protein [Massilia sp. BSC265]